MIRLIFMIFHIKYTFHQFDPVRTPVRSIFDSHCVIALRILVTIRALNHSSDTLSFTIFSSSSSSFILLVIHFNSIFRSSLLRFSNAILSTIFLFHIEFLLKIIEWNVISASNKHENTNIIFFSSSHTCSFSPSSHMKPSVSNIFNCFRCNTISNNNNTDIRRRENIFFSDTWDSVLALCVMMRQNITM